MKKLTILIVVVVSLCGWGLSMKLFFGSNSQTPTNTENLVLNNVESEATEFGGVLQISFSIENKGEKDVKDIELACTFYAASKTKLGETSKTLYQVVKAHQKNTFKHFNMGFMYPQTDRYNCYIKRASY